MRTDSDLTGKKIIGATSVGLLATISLAWLAWRLSGRPVEELPGWRLEIAAGTQSAISTAGARPNPNASSVRFARSRSRRVAR